MAVVLKFKVGATELSLQAGNPGFQLINGWTPRVATPDLTRDPEPIVETLVLLCQGTSQDDLASRMQSLHDMQIAASNYLQDSTEADAVWLHCKLASETGERRALVRRIDVSFRTQWFDADIVSNQVELALAVERAPYWEDTDYRALAAQNNPAAGVVITHDYTSAVADVEGDMPARVNTGQIGVAANGPTIDRLWLGFRSANKHGTLSNFLPLWELEDTDATLGTDAARAADATASPGGVGNTKLTITPGTATWAKRLSIHLGDVTANATYNLGRFLWLLRAKVSAGTWDVQLRFGYAGMLDALFLQGPVVSTSSTSWDYLTMGERSIPLGSLRTWLAPTANNLNSYEVQVWARRTDGAGTLDLDCLVPLPTDEGYCVVTGANLDPSVTDVAQLYLTEKPEGGWIGSSVGYTGYVNDHYQGLPSLQVGAFRVPVGDGRLYVVYAEASSSVLTDALSYVGLGQVYRRWLSLRGSE